MNLENVLKFYDLRHEEDRLNYGIGPLERERTRTLIAAHLSTSQQTIADLGGGTGEYSFWLAEQGHTVDLFDITPRHIEVAASRNREAARPLRSAQVGDARQLPCADAAYDFVLVHGPLYHLPERADRLRALREAKRILKPGGRALLFGISYTSSAMVGLLRGQIFEPNYVDMVRQEVETGRHVPPPNFPRFFVEGHFHRPGELEAEAREAGLTPGDSLAVEGSVWTVPDFPNAWADPVKRTTLLEVARLLEGDCYNSPHFVVACTKP